MPEHPDHEQLAAYQAGEVDRRQRTDLEAHLSGCPSCAEVVASVEHARGQLAMLETPELPPGLHDRLAVAIRSEVEAGAGRVLPHRPTPWYRRPAAFAAAAALLLIALAAPLLDLDLGGGDDSTAAGAGGAQRDLADSRSYAGGAGIPVIRLPGEVSAAKVRSTLTSDPRARLALERATSGEGAATAKDEATRSAPQAPGTQGQGDHGGEAVAPSTTAAAPTDRQACLAAATAAAGPALPPLVPVLYVEGTYRGQQATVLVTTSASQPGRTDLWVFPPGDCSSPPLATQRVP